MAHRWEFLEDATGRWRWRASDAAGAQRESTETFRSGVDCVVHAMRNGYLADTPLAANHSNRDQTPIVKTGV
jgi:hypothetical protein